MPKCFQLIGVPASGKTTWVEEQMKQNSHLVHISSDDIIARYADSKGLTYNDVFGEYISTATDLMIEKAKWAAVNNLDVIWDQTSINVKSRKRKFNVLKHYEHYAVVFKTPPEDELNRRLASRPGKNIPPNIIKSMIANFQYPTLEEGFIAIFDIN